MQGRRRLVLGLVGVLPTVLDTMGIGYDESSVDGEAVRIFHPQR